ncbi:hypothetical protein NC99_12590 [Sunxiuqinia dokdonensis]|uniref:Uncharacterized protein n=1 Tax=Sunxiuqinia dokdonensis TaxID=1409788 RepID=A0A0L8VBS3_9BACT|nr:hypothetical protein NC99_12590 [Sunxiuqinia dokdonensis]
MFHVGFLKAARRPESHRIDRLNIVKTFGVHSKTSINSMSYYKCRTGRLSQGSSAYHFA